jgi:hypothetical protein
MLMSTKQWRRLDVVERLKRGDLTLAQGAAGLGLSTRQLRRIVKRVRNEGQESVVHGNRGRAPKHKTAESVRERVLELRRTKYDGFNDQHFAEKLVAVEGLVISRATIQRMLRAAGITSPRQRRASKHRRRRDRRLRAGDLILWDGSRHDWLEGRGPKMCLMGAIDDATGEVLHGAHFVDQECTLGYLRVLRELVKSKGVPVSAYMDMHGALRRNDKHWTLEEQLAGRQEPTQVKRALDELGIQTIYALSPQAKGRVERLWGTLQDRLVSEMRLRQVTTVIEANKVLTWYVKDHNARFALPAQDANDAWRPCPVGTSADEACALQYVRQVANNNTVRIGKTVIDIPKYAGKRPTYARTQVVVRHLLNGTYCVYFKGEKIAQLKSTPPTTRLGGPRTVATWERRQKYLKARKGTESLSS